MTGLCWIRRDLRLVDHAALAACTKSHPKTAVVFVFDPNFLDPLRRKSTADRRIQFIAEALCEIHQELQKTGGGVIIRFGDPIDEIPALAKTLGATAVYWNRDYSPYARQRDTEVEARLTAQSITVSTFKDHVIFEPTEIQTDSGTPFRVFTPYSKRWWEKLDHEKSITFTGINSHIYFPAGEKPADSVANILDLIQFSPVNSLYTGGRKPALHHLKTFTDYIDNYAEIRDLISPDHTSKISLYLRQGCVSIRELVAMGVPRSFKWVNELVWREFYQMILYHHPHTKTQNFNPKYDALVSDDVPEWIEKWKVGQTGCEIVDAAMRCLNETGWMHNRLRMIVASYATKILGISWQRGERYFAWKLLDYDIASNVGGWQWSAGTGCDAAPYFRIFNPYIQATKYDPTGTFVDAYRQSGYPEPIVDYPTRRRLALDRFASLSA